MRTIPQREIPMVSYAPLKTRIFAFLLDYLVIAAYGILVVGTVSFVFSSFFTPLFSVSPVTAEWTGFIMITLPVSLYFILSECSRWQGTWEKKKLGIRVTDHNGQRIGFGRSLLRTTVKFLPWEVAHFGVWRLMLPTSFSETTIFIILGFVDVAIIVYILSPLTNKKRKRFMTGLPERQLFWIKNKRYLNYLKE